MIELPINQRIILDLYGGTGAWSRLYAEAGYDVRNITLPKYDVRTYSAPKNAYGILAACPCEVLGRCGAHRWNERTKEQVLEHCSFVTHVLLIVIKTKPKFWVIENPPGKMTILLGKPYLRFHPFEFGTEDNYTKLTYLWGEFNLPFIKYTDSITKKTNYIESLPGGKIYSKGRIKRAITPGGFAQAFFEANR